MPYREDSIEWFEENDYVYAGSINITEEELKVYDNKIKYNI